MTDAEALELKIACCKERLEEQLAATEVLLVDLGASKSKPHSAPDRG
jgi:hypothetical protein